MTRERDLPRDRDIERVLEHWLTDGVNEMPDRVYQSIFDRVERQPQALAPRLLRRLPEMNGSLRWMAAAAAVVLIAVVGFAVLGRPPDSGVGASPSPSPKPSASTAVGQPLPSELQARWMGSERTVPGIPAAAGTAFNLTSDGRSFITPANQNGSHFLESVVASAGGNTFQLTSTEVSCSKDDIGRYTWSLSSSGRVLTITAVSDDCATRLRAVPGTWWLEGCPSPDDNCLGDLDPGTYSSQFFAPMLAQGASWVPDFAAMSYTVPDGWSNSADWPNSFELRRQGTSIDGTDAILLRSDVVLASQDESCAETPLEGVERTPAAMVDWLASHPGLAASPPQAVTIGGFAGSFVDIAMAPTWTRPCPFSDGAPTVPLFTDTDPASGFHWAIGPGGRMRIYIVDLGDGRLFWADIEAADEAAFQALLPEATAIVEGLRFDTATR